MERVLLVALTLPLFAAPADDCVTDPKVLGCPLPDGDGDGIVDMFDLCPNRPETFQGYADDDGCPDEAPPPSYTHPWTVDSKVRFARDSAAVRGPSRRHVARIAAMLRDLPETPLMLQGSAHACEGDSPESRHVLALRRAEAVRDLLIHVHGVDPQRLTTGVLEVTEPCDGDASAAERREHTRVDLCTPTAP